MQRARKLILGIDEERVDLPLQRRVIGHRKSRDREEAFGRMGWISRFGDAAVASVRSKAND